MKKRLAAVVALALTISLLLPSCGPSGTGKGTAGGYLGQVTVEAVLDDEGGFLVSISSCTEQEGLGTLSAQAMCERINEAGSLAVDVISGATVTSSAVLSAAAEALKNAGLPESVLYAQLTQPYEYKYGNYDVVVVGAGAAGLTAAINAAKAGAKVLVIEKMGVAGGSAVRSMGYIAATGTDAQRYSYINDSATSFAASWISHSGVSSDQSRILSLSERSAQNLNFLSELGVNFSTTLVSDSLNDIIPKRLHVVLDSDGGSGGGGIVVPLLNAATKLGVDFVYDSRVYEILLGVGGEVCGVKAHLSGGGVLTVNAPSVILATGGFDRNSELVYELLEQKAFYSVSSPGNTGDGIELALAAGGTIGDGYGIISDLYDFYGDTNGSSSGILVTPDGERFIREDESSSAKAEALMERGSYSGAYYITDKDSVTAAMKEGVQSGVVFIASTIEELAELLGARSLVNTIYVYNSFCRDEIDSIYGKEPSALDEINKGPFYAVPYELRCFGTTGGVQTNFLGEVLSASGNPVPGLYAAGECANGAFFTEGYPGLGYSLAQVIDTGMIAGESAAKYVTSGGYTEFDDAVYTMIDENGNIVSSN